MGIKLAQRPVPIPRLITSLTVVLSDGAAYYVAETKNVSDTGLCFRSNLEFPIGTQLRLVISHPPELPRLRANGIVRWSERGKGTGIEFRFIRPQDYWTLLRFVSLQSRAQHSRVAASPQIQCPVAETCSEETAGFRIR